MYLHVVIKAWGMRDYAKNRYAMFEGNSKKWDYDKPARQNIDKMRGGWGWTPGKNNKKSCRLARMHHFHS